MDLVRAQFFASYFAQGVQGVGKNFLRHQASVELGGDLLWLQVLYNLLPEYGSLPWTLKPGLMFLAERGLSSRGRLALAAASALVCGGAFAWLAWGAPTGTALLLCAALMSTGSAIVDGLVDGRVAEASSDEQLAAECRYLCECGSFSGTVIVTLAAWALSLSQATMLAIAAASWIAVALCVSVASSSWTNAAATQKAAPQLADKRLAAAEAGPSPGGLRSLLSGPAPLVMSVTFLACMSPSLDFFLFRQQVLGLSAAQQSLVSLLGSAGFFFGGFLYKNWLAPGRPVHSALVLCLAIWPVGALVSIAVAWLQLPGTPGLLLVALEKAAADFSTAMTFMPCSVLMQLHAPRGCESSGFALMQLSGTLGSMLARNAQYGLLMWAGLSPQDGWSGFSRALGVAALWRLATAALLRVAFAPRLARAASAAAGQIGAAKPKRDA